MKSNEIYQQYLEVKKKEEQDARCMEMLKAGTESGEQIRAFMDGLIAGGLSENQAFKIVMSQVEGMMNR